MVTPALLTLVGSDRNLLISITRVLLICETPCPRIRFILHLCHKETSALQNLLKPTLRCWMTVAMLCVFDQTRKRLSLTWSHRICAWSHNSCELFVGKPIRGLRFKAIDIHQWSCNRFEWETAGRPRGIKV